MFRKFEIMRQDHGYAKRVEVVSDSLSSAVTTFRDCMPVPVYRSHDAPME
jgi:hypothetical protein